jgi:hypothetical protein
MKFSRDVWIVGLLGGTLVALPAHAEGPPADLARAIGEGIALLEAGKHHEFLARFIDPDERRDLVKDGPIEAVVREFAKDHAAEDLRIFRVIHARTPTIDGDRATFRFSGVDIGNESDKTQGMGFRKVNGFWYLQNRIEE